MKSGIPLKIGTRGSALALAQANEVASRLRQAHPALASGDAIEIKIIKTTGDRIQDRTLSEIGGKGLFTKEIEEALIAGDIDLAVHSMKDVPTFLPEGLEIVSILPREDPRDALFLRNGGDVGGLADLPSGAVVGTASLRRQAQVLAARPDLTVVPLRGNVGTRLRKLEEGQVDATLLALAGLRRLGMTERIDHVLEPEEMLPAVAQGAIGLEARVDDEATLAWLAALSDKRSDREVAAERACLAVLDGSCRTPIAALARLEGFELWLRGLIAAPDGTAVIRAEGRAEAEDAVALGRSIGEEIKAKAGSDLLTGIRGG